MPFYIKVILLLYVMLEWSHSPRHNVRTLLTKLQDTEKYFFLDYDRYLVHFFKIKEMEKKAT